MTQETRTGSTRITNPFVLGIGERPPHMGERPEVDAVFETTLEILREPRSSKARYIYMYGPRGTGKTVLLNALRRTVRTRPDPDILLQLSVNAVATEAGMRKVLLRPTIEMTGDQPETGVSVLATSESLDKAHEWVRSWLRRFRLPQAELVRDIEGLQPTEMRFNVGLGSLTLTMPERSGRIPVASGWSDADYA